MTHNIVTVSAAQISDSPFDSIRRYDKKGNEWWSARDLQKMLGYVKWQMFENAIEQGLENLESAVGDISNHALLLEVSLGRTNQKGVDYRLSRIACYHIALACDSRGKPNVKAAKHYFAVKTREAEVIIPAQSERLRELEIELKLEQERNKRIDRQDSMLKIHGREVVLALSGCSDAIVRDEVKVTEVINLDTGTIQKFLSADQLKVEVQKRTGQKVKSLKSFTETIRKAGRDDLLIAVTRPATSEYISPDKLDEAIAIVYGKQRQKLIGE
ncbi:MAG: BRO family protein [Chroococcidiopsis sp.]